MIGIKWVLRIIGLVGFNMVYSVTKPDLQDKIITLVGCTILMFSNYLEGILVKVKE